MRTDLHGGGADVAELSGELRHGVLQPRLQQHHVLAAGRVQAGEDLHA